MCIALFKPCKTIIVKTLEREKYVRILSVFFLGSRMISMRVDGKLVLLPIFLCTFCIHVNCIIRKWES